MTKTLRVRSKLGWTTKPPANNTQNQLTAYEVDSNFLELESQIDSINTKLGSGNINMGTIPADVELLKTQMADVIGRVDVLEVGAVAPVDEVVVASTYTSTVNNTTDASWSSGIWIGDSKAGLQLPVTVDNILNVNVGTKFTLANGATRVVTSLTRTDATISVFLDGPSLKPNIGAVGSPNLVTISKATHEVPKSLKVSSTVFVQISDYSEAGYTKGVWSESSVAGLMLEASLAAMESVQVGSVIKLSNNQNREVTSVTVSGSNMAVFLTGSQIDSDTLGFPNKISVVSAGLTPATDNVSGLPLVGINIASTADNPWFDASGYPIVAGTAYRSPTTDLALWQGVVQAAINTSTPWIARIGISGERMIGQSGNTLNPTYVAQIRTELDTIHSLGGKVLLDLHNYGRWWTPVSETIYNLYPGVKRFEGWNTHPAVRLIWTPINSPLCPITNNDVVEMWRKIAVEFKDHPGLWGYGLMNEPHDRDVEQFSVEKNCFIIYQAAIKAIRSVDISGRITIGGNGYSSALMWPTLSDNLKTLVDPADRLYFEAHQYNDANNGGGGQWVDRTSAIDIAVSLSALDPWINWLKTNNLRGFLGEFGRPDTVPNQAEFHAALQDKLIAENIPYTQWRAGGGMPDDSVLGINKSDGTLHATAIPLRDRMGTMTSITGYGPA